MNVKIQSRILRKIIAREVRAKSLSWSCLSILVMLNAMFMPAAFADLSDHWEDDVVESKARDKKDEKFLNVHSEESLPESDKKAAPNKKNGVRDNRVLPQSKTTPSKLEDKIEDTRTDDSKIEKPKIGEAEAQPNKKDKAKGKKSEPDQSVRLPVTFAGDGLSGT